MQILLTGGAASGKSEYAEYICMKLKNPLYYIATMQPYGTDGKERVIKHRKMREGKGFITIEKYTDIGEITMHESGTVVLECLGNLTANEMFLNGSINDPTERIIKGYNKLCSKCENIVIVSNDIGSDGFNYDEPTMTYIKALGSINKYIASKADAVIEVVAGIPVMLKGEMKL